MQSNHLKCKEKVIAWLDMTMWHTFWYICNFFFCFYSLFVNVYNLNGKFLMLLKKQLPEENRRIEMIKAFKRSTTHSFHCIYCESPCLHCVFQGSVAVEGKQWFHLNMVIHEFLPIGGTTNRLNFGLPLKMLLHLK